MTRAVCYALSAAALTLFPLPARAADGVLILQKMTSGGTTTTNQVQIERQRMRADVTGPNGEAQVIVFDGARQVLYVIRPAQKSYMEMTKADVDRTGAQMSDAMSKMQEMLKNLPPEQRAQMEAMMKGRGMAPAAAASRTEFKRSGTDTVGKWTCDKYEGYRNNEKVTELCTVSPQALGFTAEDFEVSRQLAEFLRGLLPQNADAVFQVGRLEQQGFSGVPVRQTTTVAGRPMVSELTDVRRQTFDESVFAVPAGFKKDAFPLGGRGR